MDRLEFEGSQKSNASFFGCYTRPILAHTLGSSSLAWLGF